MRPNIYGSSAIRVLVIAMSVVAVVFATTIVIFQISTMRVRSETQGMLANAVPSIDRLAEARAALRALDAEMDQALLDLVEQRTVDRRPIDGARRRVAESIAAYRSFPLYELEGDLNRDLDAGMERLDGVMRRLLGSFMRREVEAAHALKNGEWRRQSDAVDGQLRRLTAFNVRHVTEHASRIDQIRSRSGLLGLGVGTGALLLAFAATFVAARAVRRQSALQEERAQELEMFSARVAHDLMSPLSSVSLALDMATAQVTDPAVGRMVLRALSVVKRVRQIVDGLLEFARSGGRPSTDARTSVPRVLGDAVEQLRPDAERVNVEIRLDEVPAVEVACAPGILTVIVINLVNNALKYMADSPARLVTVRAHKGKTAVCIEVEDTGPGLPPELAARVFDPYVRGNSSTPGLGLGLATVKRLVDGHGGRVGVKRREGAGALFWFEIPFCTKPVEGALS